MISLTFNVNAETSLMIILIVLFFSNFTILQSAYSQEDTSLPTNPTGQSQATTNDDDIVPFIIFLIIVVIIYSIYEKFTKRYGKHRERRYFPASVKEDTIRKQHHKCAICKRNVGIWDFDHKDGNRANNSPGNCQALCPNCHAKKTRGLLKHEKKSYIVWAGRIVIIVLAFLILLKIVGVIE
jgi:small-conductance mechanosensitive channel